MAEELDPWNQLLIQPQTEQADVEKDRRIAQALQRLRNKETNEANRAHGKASALQRELTTPAAPVTTTP